MKNAFLLILIFLSSSALFAQTQKVTGKVIDGDGNAVPFASILEVGTKNGTSAANDGTFSIDVNSGAKLQITAVGFQSQTVTATASAMTITMKPASNETIEEVVVTALGVAREKKSLGYAAQTVKSQEIVQAANSGLAGALQGKVSGLAITPSSGMPGASALMIIRGARSFTGDNSPLFVIDGMPVSSTADITTAGNNGVTGTDYSNRAADIDPNDIASVEILKGQAASALYGLKASNGAVIITTKSGKGLSTAKAQISFNSSVSFDRISRYPQLQTTYAQGSNGKFNPTASTSYGPKISELPNDPTYGGNTDNANTQRDGKHEGMYYVPQRAQAGLDPWVKPAVYDNVKDFFNIGKIFNNSITIMNGGEKGSYTVALGATNQDGIVPHTGMERYNARVAGDTKLSDHFTAGVNGAFINDNIDKAPSANDGLIATVYPAPASYDLKGIPNHYKDAIFKPVGYRGGAFVNPYWGMEHNTFNEKTNRFYGNTYVTYQTKFNDKTSLDLKYQIGTDIYTTNYADIWSYGSPTRGSNNNGDITQYSFTNNTLNSLITGILKWNISNDFNLTALLGNEIVNQNTEFRSQYGTDFTFPGWNHMDNTATKDATESSTSLRTFGTFADLTFDYMKMVFLEISGRTDLISTMPSKNRQFFYPSASLSFIFTELEGLKNSSVLNYGKLRLSVAQVGQAGTYLPNYYSIPAYGGGFFGGTPILYPINDGIKAYIPSTTIYDPELKPQNTNSFEVGTELNFLDSRIQVGYTYSHQKVKDQIFGVPLAGSTGAGSYVTNAGKIHTNAHEASLTVIPLRTHNMEWSIGANFTKVDNYVDELAPGVESIFLGGFTTPQVRASVGDKFPVIYGTSFLRNDKGQVIVGEDGVPLSGAPGVIGSASPDFNLGANTRFRYKDFTLAAVFEWKSGGYMYSGTTNLLDNYGASKLSADAREQNQVIFPNSVREDGTPNTTVVKGYNEIQSYFQNLNSIDEASIYKSSFIKMRELSLKYQLIKKADFGLALNAFARNFLLWTTTPQLDPESSQGNTNMAGSFERFTLPQTRSIGFGVNVTF